MAPMKRPAASSAAGAKRGKVSAVAKQCREVAAAVKGAEGWPKEVLTMLAENTDGILGSFKEERHSVQVKCGEMILKVMESIEASINGKIKAVETKLSQADSEKANLEAKQAEAAKDLETKKEATSASESALEQAGAEAQAAQKAVTTAKKEQKDGDVAYVATEQKKSSLETAMKELLTPLKEGTIEEGARKKAIQDVAKLGKDFVFDNALLNSLPSALGKKPEDRGSFDGLVLTQLEQTFAENMAKLSEALEAEAPAKEARASKLSEAQAALEAAKAKEQSCEQALKEAQEAQKAAEANAKAAVKAVKQYLPELKKAAEEVESLKDELNVFMTGPKAAYEELLERSSVEPAEEAPAEEAPAEEAPAEAAAE